MVDVIEVYVRSSEVVTGSTVIGRPVLDHWCTAKETLKTEKVMPEADKTVLEIVRKIANERGVKVEVFDTSSFRGKLKAKAKGVKETPTILIGKNKIEGIPNEDQILKLLQK